MKKENFLKLKGIRDKHFHLHSKVIKNLVCHRNNRIPEEAGRVWSAMCNPNKCPRLILYE